MSFFIPRYDPWVVALSIALASFASYVALDLAKRVRTGDRRVAVHWLIGGSVVMGTGIWSMHFIGMLSFEIPITLGYTPLLTGLSWVAAVAASAIALHIAGQRALGSRRLALGATTMGAGIFAMHYIGMAALDMSPAIVWSPALIAASLAIAVAASGAALLIFVWLRRFSGSRSYLYQGVASGMSSPLDELERRLREALAKGLRSADPEWDSLEASGVDGSAQNGTSSSSPFADAEELPAAGDAEP